MNSEEGVNIKSMARTEKNLNILDDPLQAEQTERHRTHDAAVCSQVLDESTHHLPHVLKKGCSCHCGGKCWRGRPSGLQRHQAQVNSASQPIGLRQI